MTFRSNCWPGDGLSLSSFYPRCLREWPCRQARCVHCPGRKVMLVELLAWIPARMRLGRRGEHSNDDDCKLNRLLCRIRRHHGPVTPDFNELLRYFSRYRSSPLTIGLAFVLSVVAALFIAAQVMFE